ncbi:MAG: lambda exonuclease family protein [Planctomycetota bacterium]
MIVVQCEQGTPAWDEARRGLATASCFAEIISKGRKAGEESVGRRDLRLRLALERRAGATMPSYSSPAMRLGTERESEARLAYEVETGMLVEQVGFCRHDSLLAGASPDGLLPDVQGAIECKCPGWNAHALALDCSTEPPQYRAQIQGVMWVCGLRFCDFVSYCPDFEERLRLVIVRVKRDQAYIDMLAAEIAVFLEDVAQQEAYFRDHPGRKHGIG